MFHCVRRGYRFGSGPRETHPSLGIFAGARVFAFSGVSSISSLQLFATGGVDFPNAAGGPFNSPAAWWFNDANNNSVTSFASFQSAINLLRSPQGRNASYTWPNPMQWNTLNVALSTPDPTNSLGGGAQQTVESLQTIGIEPVLVFSLTCAQFNFSTLNASSPTYWAERYELYKMQYMTATWAFRQGVRKTEFWCGYREAKTTGQTGARRLSFCPWQALPASP